jgi:hypothetical protein
MFRWEIEMDIKADEFGIYDGRAIAQQLVATAAELILPYVRHDTERASRIMLSLLAGAGTILAKRATEAGGLQWAVHCDADIAGDDVPAAMQRHIEATKEITDALLERVGRESLSG